MADQHGETQTDPGGEEQKQQQQNGPPTTFYRFFELQSEIRIMIYEFQYGEKRNVKLRWRIGFEHDESFRQKQERRKFVPGRFPESPFSCMLVNKRFLDEAAQVWTRTKTVTIRDPVDFDQLFLSTETPETYFMAFITSLNIQSMSRAYKGCMSDIPKLTRLRIGLAVADFETSHDGKTPFEHRYTDVELAAFPSMAELLKLRGITSLTIEWDEETKFRMAVPGYEDEEDVQDSEEIARVTRFKSQVESLVRDVICQPRGKTSTTTTRATLQEALSMRSTNGVFLPNPTKPESKQSEPQDLTTDDTPEQEDQLLRKFLLQPAAMTKWIIQAKKSQAELNKLLSQGHA